MTWDLTNKEACKMLTENFQAQVYWFPPPTLEHLFIIKESYLMANTKSHAMGCISLKKVGVDFLEYVETFTFAT